MDCHLSTVGLLTVEYSPSLVHYIPLRRMIYDYNRRRIGLTTNVAEQIRLSLKKQEIQIKFALQIQSTMHLYFIKSACGDTA